MLRCPRRRTRVPFCAGLGLALLAGCQRPAPPDGPTAAVISADHLETVWQAALAELRRHDFPPDRQDRAAGVIVSLPTTSEHWSEPWRRDTADPYGRAQASLHTVQRQVTVRFVRGPEWTVEVQVDVLRLSRPDSQITTASSAIQAFSGVLPSTDGSQQIEGQVSERWVPLGRDGRMEERLLRRILARAGAA
jgi:hypothetical protein